LKVMSQRSFSLVDHKVGEAEFFLTKLGACAFDFFAARCYAGAFVASARSITFALQAVLGDADGFPDWYAVEQDRLRANRIARFFHQFRTVNQHIGDNLVSGSSVAPGRPVKYWFQPTPEVPEVPDDDVMTACREYFCMLLCIVFDCYLRFGPVIDARQRYTAEYFASIGKTIEDAEEECGFPRGWTDIGDPASLPYRWQALRDQAGGCEIDQLFETYLGRTTPCPERLAPYVPPEARGSE
jgi:hypothetical protein